MRGGSGRSAGPSEAILACWRAGRSSQSGLHPSVNFRCAWNLPQCRAAQLQRQIGSCVALCGLLSGAEPERVPPSPYLQERATAQHACPMPLLWAEQGSGAYVAGRGEPCLKGDPRWLASGRTFYAGRAQSSDFTYLSPTPPNTPSRAALLQSWLVLHRPAQLFERNVSPGFALNLVRH